MKSPIYIVLMSIALACSSKKTPDEKEFLESTDSLNQAMPAIDESVVSGLLEQIPSPLEISVLLKESGTKYNSSILNEPGNISKYNTNYKKALNLGIYGADLGYTNIYGQKMEGVRYLSSIKTLADDLSIGQFFDIVTISKLASNSDNLDSLLLVTTQNFNSINQYLQSQNRANVSVMLLVGGWIEAMQIICGVASQNLQNKALIERIGEQKIILEQIVILLTYYQNDQQLALLLEDLQGLKTIFDKVSITYTYKESTMEIVNGVAVIKDNSTSSINITKEVTMEIIDKISAIRNKIIS